MVDLEIEFNSIEKLLKDENFELAITKLEDLLEISDESKKIIDFLIKVLFKYGYYLTDDYIQEYEKSIDIYKKIIQIDPKNYRAFYNLGLVYFELKRFDESLNIYEKAIALKPDYKHCLYNIGLTYEALGKLKMALNYYSKALRIDPKFRYAYAAYEDVRKRIENFDEKLHDLNNGKDIDKLKKLLKFAVRIRIEIIQELLGVTHDDLLDILISWGEKFDVVLDGDYIVLDKDKIMDLINSL